MSIKLLYRQFMLVLSKYPSLLFIALLVVFQQHVINSAAANGCNAYNIATVSCQTENDPGVVRSFSNDYRHVGNPIDVVSGSKQQHELDFQAVGSPLHFSRYYHSSLVEENYSLGQGWRHSYMVKLYEIDEKSRRIQQADGRWISFTLVENDEDYSEYFADEEYDGYLVEDKGVVWKVPDGRQMHFQGSHLVRIEYPHGFDLHLKYENKRLASVTDQQGRSLGFEYTAGRAGLPDFKQTENGVIKGHLSSIRLPSGERIHYMYDKQRNLLKAKYSDTQSSEYEYNNIDYPHHLNSIINDATSEEGHRTWTYDDSGRVVRYENLSRRLKITLTYEVGSDGGITEVKYDRGREEIYRWSNSAMGRTIVDVEFKACIDCKTKVWRPKYKESNVRDRRGGDDEDYATTTKLDKKFDEGFPYEYPTYDQLTAVSNSSDLTTELVLDGASYTFYIETERTGGVSDIRVGSTSMQILLTHWTEGTLEKCDFKPLFERSRLITAPEKGCVEDVFYLVELATHVEEMSKRHGMKRPASSKRMGIDGGGLNECRAIPFDSCEELRRDYQLAQLSYCAYQDEIEFCGDGWESVEPNEVGLAEDIFKLGSFSATLFFHAKSREYIVAYRGTDDTGDWRDNVVQYRGEVSKQYRSAVVLAKQIKQALPKAAIAFTGHSLGGGLATAAALSVNAVANVFNPASFLHATANKLDIETYTAFETINVTTVKGDALTQFQKKKEGYTIALGTHTEIDPPSQDWVHEKKQQMPSIARIDNIVLHSMEAVLASEESLLGYCDDLLSNV